VPHIADYSDPSLTAPDVTGELAVGSGLSGINPANERPWESDTPWAATLTPPLRKLTHFRAPGLGAPMWSGQCVYDIPGVSESISEYDSPDPYAEDDDLRYSITAGVVKYADQLNVGEPTMTRRSRVSAHFDSAPAARHFQGYWNPRWSGMFVGMARPTITPRPLFQNANPNQKGSKELHKATQYNPVPPMGALTSYYGTGEPKAL
jgi:hypothetical protein